MSGCDCDSLSPSSVISQADIEKLQAELKQAKKALFLGGGGGVRCAMLCSRRVDRSGTKRRMTFLTREKKKALRGHKML